MKIAIMSSPVFQEVKEIHGKDRIIWGGAERYLLELCKLIRSLGHSVSIVQQLPMRTPEDAAIGRMEKLWEGFTVQLVASFESTDAGFGSFSSFNANFNELADRYDLRIYFVTSMTYPYVLHPCISVSHGVYWDFPGSALTSGDTAYRNEVYRRIADNFLQADVCVAVDYNVKNVVRAMFPGADKRICVVNNFVDCSVFAPANRVENPTPIILFPRRFTNVRGCNDFIEASIDLPKYKFRAVGQADKETTETAVRQIPSIEYTFVHPSRMAALYAEADVTVIPTKCAEGLSLSLLEAMASGNAIVTTMNGGLGDAVIPGYNAIVYDPDMTGCTKEIDLLVKDKKLRKKFSIRCVEIVRESFDISIWRSKWTKIINLAGA